MGKLRGCCKLEKEISECRRDENPWRKMLIDIKDG